MSEEGVEILCAMYSDLKIPPSEAEITELLKFFIKERKEAFMKGFKEGIEETRRNEDKEEEVRTNDKS